MEKLLTVCDKIKAVSHSCDYSHASFCFFCLLNFQKAHEWRGELMWRYQNEQFVFWPSSRNTLRHFYSADSFGSRLNWTESPEEMQHIASLAIQNTIEYVGKRIDFFICPQLFRSEIQFSQKWNLLTVMLDFLPKGFNDWGFYKWLCFLSLKWHWTSLFFPVTSCQPELVLNLMMGFNPDLAQMQTVNSFCFGAACLSYSHCWWVTTWLIWQDFPSGIMAGYLSED